MTSSEWEELYSQFSGKVMGYIISRVQRRADAEDLCSDVFEKVYRKYDAYDSSKASVSTWIFTITRNTVIDYYRRKRPTEELDENLADDSEVDESVLNEESLSELAAALRELSPELQKIVVLMYYDGKPMTEVAQIMHLSYGAVKLRHQKALAKLKGLLGA